MKTLQQLIDATPAQGTCVLTSGTLYSVDRSVVLNGKTLQGNGATIKQAPTQDREEPVFIVSGNNPRVLGCRIIGVAENGAGYNPALEAQHAIRLDSAQNAEIGNNVMINVNGDGVYFGPPAGDVHGKWTTGTHVHDCHFDGMRHALTPVAAQNTLCTGLTIGHVTLGIVDIEPPGHPWGCIDFYWTNSTITDGDGGYVLASKGVGLTNSVRNINVSGIHCTNRPFTVNVNPPAGTRRSNFSFNLCSGADVANSSPFVFRHVDGIKISGITQRLGNGVKLVNPIDCTNVIIL